MNEHQNQRLGHSSSYWLMRGIVLGIGLLVVLNACSYFLRSDNGADLIEDRKQAIEAIGFPLVAWQEDANHSGEFDLRNTSFNVLFGLAAGLLLGVVFIIQSRFLNLPLKLIAMADQKVRQEASGQSKSLFQFSVTSLLMMTTVAALVVGMLSLWSGIRRVPVKSSNIVSAGYSSFSETLELEFQGGRVYQYFQVPRSEFEAFMSAPSLGRYHSNFIRNKFGYQQTFNDKSGGGLMVVFILGPLLMLVAAVTPRGFNLTIRLTIAGIFGVGLFCVAMFTPINPNPQGTRVVLAAFVCWAPQIAIFLTIYFVFWAVRMLTIAGELNQVDT